MTEQESQERIPEGWEQVGTAGDGKPIVTNGTHRKIIVNGGLLNVGNPGNSGGSGRPAEKVRLDATKGLEENVANIAALLTTLVARAGQELSDSGNLNQGLATMREISRVANTLTGIGPGTKVTNVVEQAEWIGRTREAMEEAGIEPSLVVQALKLLESRL